MKTFMKAAKKNVETFCKEYLYNYSINDDLSVDAYTCYIVNRSMTELPITFNRVEKSFMVYNNELTTLKGCPAILGESLVCFKNRLTNLSGCTSEINGTFDCSDNLITNFKGGPKKVKYLECRSNLIRDIYDMPTTSGYISISNNPVFILISHFITREDRLDWIEFFNDCDIIRDDHIIWDRLVFFYDYLDIEIDNNWEKSISQFYIIKK